MSRHIGVGDIIATARVAECAAKLKVDVLHGHGAKGGAYTRLAGARNLIRVYTPHGGSLHYRWDSPGGLLYLTLERLLMRRTDLFLFESDYGRTAFSAKIGRPAFSRVVHNGVSPAEFEPVIPDAAATDLLFVGELRFLKGVDVLIGLRVVQSGPSRRSTAARRPTRAGPRPSTRCARPASRTRSSPTGAARRRSGRSSSRTRACSPRTPSTCTSSSASPSGCWRASARRASSTTTCRAPASRRPPTRSRA